jgi:hypothetical protein
MGIDLHRVKSMPRELTPFAIAGLILALTGCARSSPPQVIRINPDKVYALHSGECVTLRRLPAGWQSQIHQTEPIASISFVKPVNITEWRKGIDEFDHYNTLLGGLSASKDNEFWKWIAGENNASLKPEDRWPERDSSLWIAYHTSRGRITDWPVFLWKSKRRLLRCVPANPPYQMNGACSGVIEFTDPKLSLGVGFPFDASARPEVAAQYADAVLAEISRAAETVPIPCPPGAKVPAYGTERDPVSKG